MLASATTILKGLLLAFLAASISAILVDLASAGWSAAAGSWINAGASSGAMLFSALIISALVIALAEARRIRGIVFWPVAGAAVAVAADCFAGWLSGPSPSGVLRTLGLGALAGYVYWTLAGFRSGHLWAEIRRRSGSHTDEFGL